MRPNINVTENGIAVTREMTEEEHAEYLAIWEEESETAATTEEG